jgi:hypothetical protein
MILDSKGRAAPPEPTPDSSMRSENQEIIYLLKACLVELKGVRRGLELLTDEQLVEE